MKRILPLLLIALAGCASMQKLHQSKNPYDRPQFYQRYLNANDPFDQRIQRTVDALHANPNSAPLHNELGQLLVDKGFPNDAEKEFSRAIRADRNFYPAYYNRAQLRAAQGDAAGAHRDFLATIHHKPGHAEALFQLGLIEEKQGHSDAALRYYTKAFAINRSLLDVHVNPRILDSELVPLALLKAYPKLHSREQVQFVGTPSNYTADKPLPAPSPQPTAQQIVPPAPPATDPGTQKPKP